MNNAAIAEKAIKALKALDGERRIIDKHKFFFGKERTWKEASETIPLCPDTTPKRYDLVSEGLAHATEVEGRMKTGKARRFIDTHTDDLAAGLDRALKFLDGKPEKTEEKPTWKTKESKERPDASAETKSARQDAKRA